MLSRSQCLRAIPASPSPAQPLFRLPSPTMSGQKSQCLNVSKPSQLLTMSGQKSQCLNVSKPSQLLTMSGQSHCLNVSKPSQLLTMSGQKSQCLNVSKPSQLLTMSRQKSQCLNVSEPSQSPSPVQPFRLRSPTMPASPTMPNYASQVQLCRESNYASRAQLCLASPTMPREPDYASRAQLCPTTPSEANCASDALFASILQPSDSKTYDLKPQNRQPFEMILEHVSKQACS